jgi:Molybdopterin-guanine dinucleotide biosynthesis protein A
MFSGIVLAGGKSKRMGTDKRYVLLSGKSLLEISVDRLKGITDEILVVMGEKENLEVRDVRFVLDVEKNRGPMIGLFSGLCEMKNFYGLVTPVDNPLISNEFLSYLKEKAVGYDLVIPSWKRGIEPLIAVYSKNAIPVMKQWIRKEKKLAPHLFIQELNLKVRFIEEEEIAEFGNPEILFFNINTEEDLRKAESLVGEKS